MVEGNALGVIIWANKYMTTDKMETFLQWLDSEEKSRGWTDYRLANEAGINPSVLSRARSGTLPKWEACVSIAQAFRVSPITVFRAAGLLPSGSDDKISYDDWKYLLEKMTPEERDEVWRISQMKVEIRQEKERASRAKNFKPGKVRK